MEILFSDFYLYGGPGPVECTLTSLEIPLWKKMIPFHMLMGIAVKQWKKENEKQPQVINKRFRSSLCHLY